MLVCFYFLGKRLRDNDLFIIYVNEGVNFEVYDLKMYGVIWLGLGDLLGLSFRRWCLILLIE